MRMNNFMLKVQSKIKNLILFYIFTKPRIFFYKIMSDCWCISGKPICYQPVRFTGKGKIIFGRNVRIGVFSSPYFLNGYAYIEARKFDSCVEIGDDCWINNSPVLISNGKRIKIGKKCLIGCNLEITDSDFHDLNPASRSGGNVVCEDVIVGDNVFIGNNVTIMKGVIIGNNCVIGNRSVVVNSFSDDYIIAGQPAKVIRKL